MAPIILRVEMGRTAEAAANIDRYRHPLIPGRLDLGGRRRTSPDKLLLSLLLSAGERAGSTGEGAWIRKNRDFSRFFKVVPVEGLEPPLPFEKQILSLSRLPFRHTGRCCAEGEIGPQAGRVAMKTPRTPQDQFEPRRRSDTEEDTGPMGSALILDPWTRTVPPALFNSRPALGIQSD